MSMYKALCHTSPQMSTTKYQGHVKRHTPSCTCRQLRNTSKHSKFIKEFWHSPTVNALLVNALDYDIVPTMDFEMGHVNLQVDFDGDL